jgi:hypothetical protein
MVQASKAFSAHSQTDKQRDTRHQLQLLTADDPDSAANMARFVLAMGLMVTGVHVRERTACEPIFSSGFILSREERDILMAASWRLGIAQVFMAFDVHDAMAPPRAVGVFRVEGDSVAVYPRCELWAPAANGRAVLVPYGPGAPRCHFVARRGQPLARIDGWPTGDLDAGILRGRRRLDQLARSVELKDGHIGAYRSVITTKRGGFDVDVTQLAA